MVKFPKVPCHVPKYKLEYKDYSADSPSWVYLSDKEKTVVVVKTETQYDFLGKVTCTGVDDTIVGTITLESDCKCLESVCYVFGRFLWFLLFVFLS